MTLYRNLISHLEQANLPQSHRFLITLLSPRICTRLFLPLLLFVHSAWIQPGIFFSGTMHVLQYKVTLERLYIPSDGSPVNCFDSWWVALQQKAEGEFSPIFDGNSEFQCKTGVADFFGTRGLHHNDCGHKSYTIFLHSSNIFSSLL